MHFFPRSRLLNFLPVVMLLVYPAYVRSQSNASIQGEVTDQNGSVIPQASVKVLSELTGVERTAVTDLGGRYQFASLPLGDYRLQIQATVFKTQIIRGVHIEVQQIVEADIRLEVGDITQQVSITSNISQIELATISVGHIVNERTVQELPLNGRHFIELGLLIPGSVTPPQSGFLSSPERGKGSFALNTSGNREDAVNLQVNGINLNDQFNNTITFLPPVSSI